MSEDPITEMRFALAEGEASDVAAPTRSRLLELFQTIQSRIKPVKRARL